MSKLTRGDTGEEETMRSSIVVAAERALEEYETVRLSDGRRFSYAEFGDPAGEPVFFFHGFPGSRAQAAPTDPVARELGIRVIAPDRPGVGGSDPLSKRTLIDWPADVEGLADALNIEEFSVLGISGGGPYAAACAAVLPERVRAASLVSSVAPLDATSDRGFKLPFQLSRYASPIARLLFWWGMRGIGDDLHAATEARTADAPPVDVEYWRMPVGQAVLLSARPALEHGVGALVNEAAVYARPWGFDLDVIDVPTFVWHGDADENVPFEMGEHLAEQIPVQKSHFLSGEGHLSTVAGNIDEILRELIEC